MRIRRVAATARHEVSRGLDPVGQHHCHHYRPLACSTQHSPTRAPRLAAVSLGGEDPPAGSRLREASFTLPSMSSSAVYPSQHPPVWNSSTRVRALRSRFQPALKDLPLSYFTRAAASRAWWR